ncbi:MAG TPA: molybdopterin-synthase adenylyltransferase MoeB [bacterium]|nr:molybdopterin-synthase adenylyltransferase MoeB [bacterium]
MSILSNEEILRYSRHLIMPEVGMAGQEKLKAASVLLIGAGGLGSPLAMYLSAAGVGRLGLVDFDVVDHSNLHRQVIHATANVGKPKVESAKARIAEINPNVEVRTYNEAVTRENILGILKDYDIVIDGTDNFPTRYLVNDAAVMLGKANIYGSIFRFDGQVTVFDPKRGGPCYRCLYPEPPPPGMVPSCAEGGVLGVLPGSVGLLQATEAIKLIIGQGKPLIGRLLLFNALDMSFRELKIRRDKDCPMCGDHPSIKELIDYEQFCGMGRGNEEAYEAAGAEIDAVTLKEWADAKKKFVLVDVREPQEWEIAHIEGAKLIPLGQLPARVNELDTADEIVLQCHHGSRSARAQAILGKFGFKKTYNLAGGIDAWAVDVEPGMPRY